VEGDDDSLSDLFKHLKQQSASALNLSSYWPTSSLGSATQSLISLKMLLTMSGMKNDDPDVSLAGTAATTHVGCVLPAWQRRAPFPEERKPPCWHLPAAFPCGFLSAVALAHLLLNR
jgi:hypothetical protein